MTINSSIKQVKPLDLATSIVDKTMPLLPFRVTWKDLTYTVPTKLFGRGEKTILHGITGYFDSGKITGIMGPSGSGKSSLLGCLTKLKTKGVTGSITISTDIEVKFAFIAQNNYILERLTVRESMYFASQLKNGLDVDHKAVVEEVIKKLMIEKCADNRPSRCSGGQLKRVLIACELLSKPNILILDEPTSGLDSVTAWQLVNLMIELTRSVEPVAVVMTIHQPSARLFNLLDQVYLMSYEGQCIYNGSPKTMQMVFNRYELQCPAFTNPSDFALEVAANEHGNAKLLMLSTAVQIEALDIKENKYGIKNSKNFKTMDQIVILTKRSLLTMFRDPIMMPTRVIGYVLCAILISIFFGFDSGELSGCAEEFAIDTADNFIEKMIEHRGDMVENVCCLVFSCLLGWLGGIFPVLLVFPSELDIFLKEHGNGYYSSFTYFMSKVLSDLPFSLVLPNLASIPIYLMTSQYMDPIWRLFNFAFIYILVTLNSSAIGFLVGALLSDYPTAIAFLGVLSFFPLIILSGVMISVELMPKAFQYLTNLNYLRFGLVACLLNSYGFGRCSDSVINKTSIIEMIPPDKALQILSSDKIDSDFLISMITSLTSGGFLEDRRSEALREFNLREIDYFIAIFVLMLHLFFYRYCTYLTIKSKIKAQS